MPSAPVQKDLIWSSSDIVGEFKTILMDNVELPAPLVAIKSLFSVYKIQCLRHRSQAYDQGRTCSQVSAVNEDPGFTNSGFCSGIFHGEG